MKKPFVYIFLLFMLLPLWAKQALIEVDARADTTLISVGDRITYELAVQHVPDIMISLPEKINLSPFEILDSKTKEPEERDGLITQRWRYFISVYDTGRTRIPPVHITYWRKGQTEQTTISSAAIPVRVRSVLPDTAQAELQDIKKPLDIPFDYMFLWAVLAIVAILIIAAWMGYRLWRKKQEQGYMFTAPEKPRPAHEVALEQLQELFNSPLISRGEYKPFFSRLSEILRGYVEKRYFVQALEETTNEIMRDLDGHTTVAQKEQLEQMLRLADLVKFAKYIPSAGEIEPLRAESIDFVEQTKVVYTETSNEEQQQEAVADNSIKKNA